MGFLKVNKNAIFFGIIVLIIIITRFLPISFGDLYNDNAINSFRAFGWFDFLGKSGQTTPFIWLGYIPAWGVLSFHDAPPMAFLIQHVFFVLLGDSATAARLPFVLSGIGSIFLSYYLLKKIINEKTALLASLLYAVSSYGIWAGQAGYLEGIEEFFIVASVLFGGMYFLKENKPKYLYAWILFAVCAALTKYTTIFLIPPIVIYALIYREILKKHWKHLLISLVLASILVSPIAIYNAKVYKLRGHFDAALSSMVGMHPDDYSIISGRGPSFDIIENVKSFFNILEGNMSYPFFILMLLCLAFLLWNTRKKGWRTLESWVMANFFFLILLFGFTSSKDRFLSIAVPFLVIIVALGVVGINQSLKNLSSRISFNIVVGLVLSFELFYAVNTNVINNPIGKAGWFHSENKILNLGFNQLDDFIRGTIIRKLPKQTSIKTKEDTIFRNNDVEGKSVVIFDDRILWFSQMWYFQKYFLYYRWPVISTAFLSALNENKITVPDLMEVSGQPMYFIYPISALVMDPVRVADNRINVIGPELAKSFHAMKSATTTIIKNENGTPVFRIYKITI